MWGRVQKANIQWRKAFLFHVKMVQMVWMMVQLIVPKKATAILLKGGCRGGRGLIKIDHSPPSVTKKVGEKCDV